MANLQSGVSKIQNLSGYRLPLVAKNLVSGWLPVTTGYENLGLKFSWSRSGAEPGYDWLSNLTSKVTKFTNFIT